jgi:hypothetical protein
MISGCQFGYLGDKGVQTQCGAIVHGPNGVCRGGSRCWDGFVQHPNKFPLIMETKPTSQSFMVVRNLAQPP